MSQEKSKRSSFMERVYKGQIYLAHLKGIGSEQQGKRPVVILQNNTGNRHSPTTIIAPITTADRRRMLPVHVTVRNNQLFQGSMVLLEQIQVMDKSRLGKHLCDLNETELENVDKAIRISFALAD